MGLVKPGRLAEMLAANDRLIGALREHGDIESATRPTDVRFTGDEEKIRLVKANIEKTEWRVVGTIKLDSGECALDIQRDQTTESAPVRELTEWALKIEAEFGVHYDGWQTELRKRF